MFGRQQAEPALHSARLRLAPLRAGSADTLANDLQLFNFGWQSGVQFSVAINTRYYNEHEWRVFFTEAGRPKHSFTKEQFEKQKKILNEQLWKDKEKAYLTFDNQEKIITYIIVPEENEIPALIDKIRGLKSLLGCSIPENKETFIKDIIISKITSFERIEAEY